METNRDKRIVVGSVVQVKGEVNKDWGGCLLIVSETKPFGVQAYTHIPMQGDAYIRLKWDEIEYVGLAVYVNDDEE